MAVREIVHIDEEKCDGCGLCVPSCEEGAIQIIDGKAKVVSDIYCDGLGACLGHCPQGAITIIQREADDFDEAAVAQHLAAQNQPAPQVCGQGCPGTAAESLPAASRSERTTVDRQTSQLESQLGNWPVQLHLVPPQAPYLHRADLLLVADCVPFACANFHSQILDGRPVVIGCPKLDDCSHYVAKLAAIIQQSGIRSISVVHMEVPCCTGLTQVAQAAIQQAGAGIPLQTTIVSRRGDILDRSVSPPATGVPGPATSPTQLPIL